MTARGYCLGVLVGLGVLAGCSAQADNGYKGEPMMVVSGSVTSSDVALTGGAVPVLGWYGNRQMDDSDGLGVFESVEVTGEFPNRFNLWLFQPPTPDALAPGRDGKPRGAFARIFALREGGDWDVYRFHDVPTPDWVLGGVGDFLVLYLEGEMPATGYIRTPDGEPAELESGYHLIRLAEWTEEERIQERACDADAGSGALADVNAAHDSSYTDVSEMPDAMRDEYYELREQRERPCGGKVKMTLVPSGIDNPVSLALSVDWTKWIDWY